MKSSDKIKEIIMLTELQKRTIGGAIAGLFVLFSSPVHAQQADYFRPWLNDCNPTNGWTDVPAPTLNYDPQNPAYPSNPESPSDPLNLTKIVYVASWGSNSVPTQDISSAQPLATMQEAWNRLATLRSCGGCGIDARIRVLRGSDFTGATAQTLQAPPVHGPWGGKGPTQPLVIEAWPPAELCAAAGSSLPRPIFRMPVDANGVSSTFVYEFSGSGTTVGGQDWGGDFWMIGLEITTDVVEGQTYRPLQPSGGIQKTQSTGERYLFEDCYFHHIRSPIGFSSTVPNGIKGVTIRRCVLTDNYNRLNSRSTPVEDQESGGVYYNYVTWGLIEECWFDKNGWTHESHPLLSPDVVGNVLMPKTVFNQAMYMTQRSQHILIQNNVVARPPHCGIQSRGNTQRIYNNLVLEAPTGIALGHAQNQGVPNPPAPINNEYYWRGHCTYNVVLNGGNVDRWIFSTTPPILLQEIQKDGSPRGRGISLTRSKRLGDAGTTNYSEPNEQGGTTSYAAGYVAKNIVANNDDGQEPNASALYSDDDAIPPTTPAVLATYAAYVFDNVFYDWTGPSPSGTNAITISNALVKQVGPPEIQGTLGAGFVVSSNYFVQPGPNKRVVARARWNPVGGTWSGNKYFGFQPDQNKRYSVKPLNTPLSQNDVPASFAGWRAATSESTQIELPSVPAFPDPTRSLGTYMQSVGLPLTANASAQSEFADEFMALCRSQRRGNWDTRLLAPTVNSYIRAGFGVQ